MLTSDIYIYIESKVKLQTLNSNNIEPFIEKVFLHNWKDNSAKVYKPKFLSDHQFLTYPLI